MNLSRLYVSFEGRLERIPYLAALLVLTLVSVTISTVGSHLFRNYPGAAALVVAMAMAAITFANVWAVLALYAKRLHDMGYSAWHGTWILATPLAAMATLVMAPMIAFVLLAITAAAGLGLVFVPGTPGPNAYGPAPGGSPRAMPALRAA